MTRRRVSNPLALAALGLLLERPMHPYEISQTLRERGKETSIKLNYGSLYSVIEALLKHKLIEVQATGRDGRRPERTVYVATAAGREEFEDWLAELLSTPTKEYPALEAGLSLMPGLPPDEVARLLEGRVERLRVELAGLAAGDKIAEEAGLPELFVIESRFRAAMLSTELDFAANLAASIRSGALGGTTVWRRMHELQAEGIGLEEMFADPVRYLGEEARALQPPTA